MADDEKDIEQRRREEDLGLGERVIEENRTRFLNRDGTFNVRRKGVFEKGAFSPYHAILNLSWSRFYAWILGIYFVANAFFAAVYFLGGRGAFPLIASESAASRFGELLYYSIQVLTTLGSSAMQPATFFAKLIVSLESIAGLLGFALGAGLTMARFSNPAPGILFSERAVVAPYKEMTGFMVRVINRRSNELIEVSATVTLAMADEHGKRTFHQLALERERVLVFPLSWTIVHPITQKSPLYKISYEELKRRNAEFLVAITAVDQDLSKKNYVRHSYVAEEIAFGARFTNILEQTKDGTLVVDPVRIHETEQAELPLPSGKRS